MVDGCWLLVVVDLYVKWIFGLVALLESINVDCVYVDGPNGRRTLRKYSPPR